MLDCPDLAVPPEVMQHVVNVESARNPFAIGVVGGYLAKQPSSIDEALAAVRQLKEEGYNFSVGIAQVNRYNLAEYGLPDYASAFQACPNLRAGSRILRECYDRAQDWGKAFSCYYSGNFVTGFDHGYVQKIFASIRKAKYAAQDGPKWVRIIPYNRKIERRPARDDDLPLGEAAKHASNQGHQAVGGLERPYPEPFAIRRYLPSTPMSATATALANASEPIGVSPMSTAERRPAIPVPGPGAMKHNEGSVHASGVAGMPVQVVGVGGDPYKTAMVLSTAGSPSASSLPLPDPDTVPPGGDSRPGGAQKAAAPGVVAARKGGALLESPVATRILQTAKPQVMEASPKDSGVGSPEDKSFVF